MTTSRFLDRFDRADGELGGNYTIPCGNAAIFDEAVIPISSGGAASGLENFQDTTKEKTQVIYTGDTMDSSDYQVSADWIHLDSIPDFLDIDELLSRSTEDPSFTVLVRMSKDPMLVDLGTEEQPFCYDQGYGLRVTCPRDGSSPILKLLKYSPVGIPPGISGPSTATEVDGAFVLASLTLTDSHLHTDPAQVSGATPLYRGYYQRIKLRIRRSDSEVILDAYLNDRGQNQPVLSFTDLRHPLWGAVGSPGFEFISATEDEQPSGSSPFDMTAIPVMACQLFEVDTVKDFAPSRVSTPQNRWTYERVTNRVITLVERNGDAKYNATVNGQQKFDQYLDFVLEAEAEIIREEGYWEWLRQENALALVSGQQDYEIAENVGEIEHVSPGSWQGRVLKQVRSIDLERIIIGSSSSNTSNGRPQTYHFVETGPNNRPILRFYPTPGEDNLEVILTYFARQLRPYDPEGQVPFIPQQNMDVLIYSAAAHALMLDTDPQATQTFLAVAQRKLQALRRVNNRKLDGRRTIMRSASDVFTGENALRIPLTRATQLDHLLVI